MSGARELLDRRRFLELTSLATLGVGARGGDLAAAAMRPRADVEIVVLGTAQDGGVPSVNCFKDVCARVRAGDAPNPRVSCLGVIDHTAGRRFMIDATPDFRAQVGELLAPSGTPLPEVRGRTVPLQEHLHGIFLTHAHIGHYSGLVHVGKEVAAPDGLPLWASARMGEFLSTNGPWDALVDNGFVDLRVAAHETPIELTPRLRIVPFEVVHRPEYSDTLGFVIEGPSRRAMFVPDADVWDGWRTPFEQLLRSVDVALIDGSFYSHDELGHRAQGDVPHPPVMTSVDRLAEMAGRPEIRFIHLNHTNPLWDPQAPQHATLPEGFHVARTGERIAL